MLKSYIQFPQVLSEAGFIPNTQMQTYLHYLKSHGYSSKTISKYLGAVIHFSRWQRQQGSLFADVTLNDKTQFIELHLPRCQCPKMFHRDKKTIAAALSHWLREVYQLPVIQSNGNDLDTLVMKYDRHLKDVSGLSSSTRLYRRRYAMEFLQWLSSKPSRQFSLLSVDKVSSYICQRATEVSLATTAAIACSLNCFLRFLSTQGLCQIEPAFCVPRPKLLYSFPDKKSLSTEELTRLLSVIDRTYPVGKRDYAMTRCLSDLGLRTSEVAGLCLKNIDWHHKVLTINSGKSRRQHKLPIPNTLIDALIDYLTDARPETKTSYLFVYHRAPFGRAVKPSTVRGVVRRAFSKAGFPASQSQVHRLRHTMATRLLMNDTSLKIIADVLGHQCINTTTRYTHVDRKALQTVALSWPGRTE